MSNDGPGPLIDPELVVRLNRTVEHLRTELAKAGAKAAKDIAAFVEATQRRR